MKPGHSFLHLIIFCLPILMGAGLLTSCSSTGTDNPTHPATTTRSFKIGVGALPRHFPDASEADWLDMAAKVPEVAEIAVAQSEWRDSQTSTGQIPIILQWVYGLNSGNRYEPQFAINFFQGEGVADLTMPDNASNDWTNASAIAKYREVALGICEKFRPQYLGLGVEVNTYWQYHPDDFARFVQVYRDLYDDIKARYPQTKLFVTFQLEKMKGLGGKTFGTSIPSHWQLLDLFGDKLDLVVFTSYPEVEFSRPSDIPGDYYGEILLHTRKKIAFSEIGWSSNNGSEADQDAFIARFLQTAPSLDPEFVDWSLMHDSKGSGPLTTVGLRSNDGAAKSAWNAWARLIQIPLVTALPRRTE